MIQASFGGAELIPADYNSAEIVIYPVPYDRTATWQKGAEFGPQAIIDASAHLELYDIETDSQVQHRGIHTFQTPDLPEHPEQVNEMIRQQIFSFLRDGKFPVMVGGDHSITPGAVKAVKEWYSNTCVLQLDAHADLRESYQGSRFSHACVMARVKEICPAVQVGIRSMSREECEHIDKTRMFFAGDIVSQTDWVNRVVELLSSRVYVTIDVDVFDPCVMPSTGTPEPGGLNWHDVVALLKSVSAKRRVIGFDVVELMPSRHNKAPDFVAAKLIFQFLSYIYSNGDFK